MTDPREALQARRDALRARQGDLRERQRGLRGRQVASREKLQARRDALAARRSERSSRRRARRPWWLALLLLPPFCLIPDCSEEAPLPPPLEQGSAPQVGAPVEVPPVPVPVPVPRMSTVPRPSFRSPTPKPLPWIGVFRLQVAARSPRLAGCFVGVERPGQLRWTAAVEPSSGETADHTLEPLLRSAAISRVERECILNVLTDPPYRLDVTTEQATPTRVGIVLEF